MSEQECIDELCSKGWTRWGLEWLGPGGWRITEATPNPNSLWRTHPYSLRFNGDSLGGGVFAGGDSVSALLRATMRGSASVTVATYFGLRAPGVV